MMIQIASALVLATYVQAQVPYHGYTCPIGYKQCSGRGSQGKCCDINPDCSCDQYCPDHPEVWAKGGCAVPWSNKGIVKRGEFICPVGYKKCKNCCDSEPDCKCDNKCDAQFPPNFDCTLRPGEDEYSTAGLGKVCPAGYTVCSRFCDLNADCKQDRKCMAHPISGFRCIVPKRHNADKTGMIGGRIEAFAKPLPFNKAETFCKKMGGHLLSIHSNEEYIEMKRAVNRARITQAVLIGGYETGRKPHEKWHWIDGTPMTTKIVKGIQSQTFGDNFGQNENQMAYCGASCVNALLGGKAVCPNCEGLHDWGVRSSSVGIEGIGGFACRVNGNSIGHLVDHRDPGGATAYQEDGAMMTDPRTGKQRKSSGWSNNEITNVGTSGTVHGPWGKATTTVTRNVRIPRGWRACYVSWRSWAIDSRDGEVDELWINDKKVWAQKAQMAFSVQADGSACMRGWTQGPPDFPNPWGGGRAPACFVDRTVSVPCKSGSNMKVRFHSGVDQPERNEAWAFSDFSIHERKVRPRPKRPTCTYQNFGSNMATMTRACCKRAGSCKGGLPSQCSATCAKAVFQFDHLCRKMIRNTPGMTNTMIKALRNCHRQGRLHETGRQCMDGKDNDFDGKGDCKDPDCVRANRAYCTETAAECKDGRDNDHDGYIDCTDSDCKRWCHGH